MNMNQDQPVTARGSCPFCRRVPAHLSGLLQAVQVQGGAQHARLEEARASQKALNQDLHLSSYFFL